jgi:chorismate dehydratase
MRTFSIGSVSFLNALPLVEASHEVDALLVIGDKAVASTPHHESYPHELDLGEAWRTISGLPFVFATWMTRRDVDLEGLPQLLRHRRDLNRSRIHDITRRYAHAHGWTVDLAEHYLGSLLRFDLGQRELKAISVFWERCHVLGLIDEVRPLELYGGVR